VGVSASESARNWQEKPDHEMSTTSENEAIKAYLVMSRADLEGEERASLFIVRQLRERCEGRLEPVTKF
jgi:hypothetical protein